MKKRFIYILLFVIFLFPINALAKSKDYVEYEVSPNLYGKNFSIMGGSQKITLRLYTDGKREVLINEKSYVNAKSSENIEYKGQTYTNEIGIDFDSLFLQTEEEKSENRFHFPTIDENGIKKNGIYYVVYSFDDGIKGHNNIYITGNIEDAKTFAGTGLFGDENSSDNNSNGNSSTETKPELNTVAKNCKSTKVDNTYSSLKTPFSTEYELKQFKSGDIKICFMQDSGKNEYCKNNYDYVTYGKIYQLVVDTNMFKDDSDIVCPTVIYEVISKDMIFLTTNLEDAKTYSEENKLPDSVIEDYKVNLGEDVEGCEVVPDVIKKWIKLALNFVKYIALVLVIVLGTLDFIKAAGSGEPDGMKKAGQAFMKRVIAVIILFLLPMLVDLILNLINLYGSTGDCFGVLE